MVSRSSLFRASLLPLCGGFLVFFSCCSCCANHAAQAVVKREKETKANTHARAFIAPS